MELAFVTGYGPALLTDLEQRRPLVRAEDTVVFGFRDADEQQQYGSQSLPTEILALDLMKVRRIGIETAMRTALDRLTRPNIEGFLVHLDADCLDDRIMPAVDYRLPDGFRWDELTSILRHALGSGRAVGLEVTIYNPSLDDADGSAGRGLTNVLATTLGTSAPWGVVEGPDAGAPRRRKHR